MFGLGGWEIAILGMALLVFFGPKKLPQLMRQAGKVMREVRKASFEFQSSLEREMEDDQYRKQHRRDKKRKQKAAELGVSPDALDPEKAAAAPNGNGTSAVNGSAPTPEPPVAPPLTPDADKPKAGAS